MADDFILGNGEFAVDLRNGTYEIAVYAGDLLPGTSTIKASYIAEGVSIGSISAKQTIGSLNTTVSILDGQLNLEIGGTNAYINGLEITPLFHDGFSAAAWAGAIDQLWIRMEEISHRTALKSKASI